MSFIQREIDRLNAAIRNRQDNANHEKMYSAQQALSCALDPNNFASPYDLTMGTQANLEGCFDPHRPPQS